MSEYLKSTLPSFRGVQMNPIWKSFQKTFKFLRYLNKHGRYNKKRLKNHETIYSVLFFWKKLLKNQGVEKKSKQIGRKFQKKKIIQKSSVKPNLTWVQKISSKKSVKKLEKIKIKISLTRPGAWIWKEKKITNLLKLEGAKFLRN